MKKTIQALFHAMVIATVLENLKASLFTTQLTIIQQLQVKYNT